jgi:hypothetical protein
MIMVIAPHRATKAAARSVAVKERDESGPAVEAGQVPGPDGIDQ